MPVMKHAIGFAIFFAVLFVASLAHSADVYPAVVSRMKGDVEIKRSDADTWITAKPDLTLASGDRIRTLASGKVEIFFPNGTFLYIKELSEVEITKESDGGGSGEVKVILGAVLLNVEKSLTSGSSFKVDGGSALGVVRGTILRTQVYRDGASAWNVFHGKVDIKSGKGKWKLKHGHNCLAESSGLAKFNKAEKLRLAECWREFAIDQSDLDRADAVENEKLPPTGANEDWD